MNKRSLLSITALLLLLLSAGTAAAIDDDCERYDPDYTDRWTTWNFDTGDSGSCYPTITAENDPKSVDMNTVMKIKTTTTSNLYSGDTYGYSGIQSIAPQSPNYLSFVYKDAYTSYDGYIYIAVHKANDNALQNSFTFSSIPDDNSKIEIIKSGEYYNLYIDGALIQSKANTYTYSGDVYYRIGCRCRATGMGVTRTAHIFIDDITTGSIIGTGEEWHESNDNITLTWSEQLMRSYPTAEHEITLYSITGAEVGEVETWTLPDDNTGGGDEWGYIYFNRSETLGENWGLYMLEMTRGSIIMTDTYFTYSQLADPVQYPDVLLLAGIEDTSADIRDDDNHGGAVSDGGEVYLYPTPVDSGEYNITYDIDSLPFSFSTQIEKVYATALNSTTVEFSGLSGQNYLIEIDGESISGTKATGTLSISGNVTDAETVSIGSDVYEFDDDSSTTGDNIPVETGTNLTTAAQNLTSAINTNGTAAVSANCTVSGVEIPDGFTYIAECTITDPSDQEGYQTAFNISQLDGMQNDGEDIRFMATNGTNLSHWIDYSSSANNSYYTGYVATPADATKIYLFFGNAGASDASDGSAVFPTYEPFDGSTSLDESTTSTSYTTGKTGQAIELDGSTSQTYLSKSITYGRPLIMESWAKIPSGNSVSALGGFIFARQSGVNGYQTILDERSYSDGQTSKSDMQTRVDYSSDGVVAEYHSTSIATDTWYYMKTTWEPDGGITHELYNTDGSLFGSSTLSSSSKYTSGKCGLCAYDNIIFDNFIVREYESTEPTLSIGTPSEAATAGATISLIADDYGTSGNSITTTETLENGTFAAATLTGGTAGSQTAGLDTWSHELTDWTNLTTHTFEFSPDMTLPGVWGYIKNSATQDGITSATITITNGTDTLYLYSDSNGMYYKTTGMGIDTYTVSASKSGYSDSIPMDVTTQAGATTRQDFYLDSSSGEGVYYAPHYVSFYFYDGVATRNPIPSIPVYIYEAADNTSVMNGTTDSTGKVGAQLSQDVKYKIVATYGTTTQTDYVYPVSDSYDIYFDEDIDLSAEAQFANSVNITIEKETINATAAQIQVYYNDSLSGTTGLQFNLYADNGTLLDSSIEGDVNTASHNFTVTDYNGKSYIVQVSGTHADFGTFAKQYGVTFGLDLKTDTFGAKAWLYFGVGFLIFIMLSFTSSKHTGIGMVTFMMTLSVFGVLGVFGTYWYLGSPLQIVSGLGWIYTIITITGEKRRAVEG